MIDVGSLYDRVTTMANKQQAGGLSSDQFNKLLSKAQNMIFEYYYTQFEREQKIVDTLSPFIKDEYIPVTGGSYVTGGIVEYPSDYVHRLELSYNYTKNNCENGTPDQELIPIDYIKADEVSYTLSDGIRKPNLDKKVLKHTIKNNRIYVYPHTLSGVWLKYLRRPQEAEYVTTISVTATGDFEVYSQAASTQLEWPSQVQKDFEDVILSLLGLVIRDSNIVSYVGISEKGILTD